MGRSRELAAALPTRRRRPIAQNGRLTLTHSPRLRIFPRSLSTDDLGVPSLAPRSARVVSAPVQFCLSPIGDNTGRFEVAAPRPVLGVLPVCRPGPVDRPGGRLAGDDPPRRPQPGARNYTAGHFSFNVDGGRCTACHGDGHIQIDMQFLADVYMRCGQCGGTRYRHEILQVTYRGRNIADVLEMTVREAFTFFRGRPKVQARLKRLIDVGLDYVRLGQPANTLSGGEAQRLKLAGYMSSAKRGRCLFILDEPTTGLHFSDVVQLLDCFDALLAVGHSLIVVEHNLQIMKAADYIIDLGPGAAEEGGRVVVKGTPEKVANCRDSVTAGFLADLLREKPQEESV